MGGRRPGPTNYNPFSRFTAPRTPGPLGQNDAAIKVLEQESKLLPDDQLIAQILQALKPVPSGKDDRPTAGGA